MAIPVYLRLKDDGGLAIKGGVEVKGREESIEVTSLDHAVSLPIDPLSGEITGTRNYNTYAFEKEIDRSSPLLYKALTTGQCLNSAEFVFYRISHAGQEEPYFSTTLEKVRVVAVLPFLLDIKAPQYHRHTHFEYIELTYEKITWHYLDGNLIHSDSWDGRITE
ncbi:type VI secretion system tube protein TssD [Erwinia sp.]|uniref:type VI secretion system tube protein TssD n=1 Tax=Erwinia citreus TaxID=558 RepID=UPI003C70938D